MILLQKLPAHPAVDFESLGLIDGSFVPVHFQPAEALQDPLDHFRSGALDIGVFNSQDEDTALLAGEQPVEKGRASATDMQVPGRTGSKSDSYAHALAVISYDASFRLM